MDSRAKKEVLRKRKQDGIDEFNRKRNMIKCNSSYDGNNRSEPQENVGQKPSWNLGIAKCDWGMQTWYLVYCNRCCVLLYKLRRRKYSYLQLIIGNNITVQYSRLLMISINFLYADNRRVSVYVAVGNNQSVRKTLKVTERLAVEINILCL